MRGFLLAVLVASAVLALAPPASADPACTTDLCGPFPPEAPAPSKCPSRTVASDVDHHNEVTLNADCTLFVQTGKGQLCVGAWTQHHTSVVGPVTWDSYSCGMPGGNPLCCLTASSASQVPPPCQYCAPPSCAGAEVSESTAFQLLGILGPFGMVYDGPHVSARLNGDCTVDVEATDVDCQDRLLPLAHDQVHEDGGRVEATADTCQIGFICACMPASLDGAAGLPTGGPALGSFATASSLPDPCGPTSLCEGPHCTPREVATTDLFGFLGPSAGLRVNGDCTAGAWEDGLHCGSLFDDGQIHEDAGAVEVTTDSCVFNPDCTCDPLPIEFTSSSAVAVQPPVHVEFVDCVRAPCPPHVWCTPMASSTPGFTLSLSQACHLTVTQDPLPCEGMRYESTVVGPVTVQRASCGPGIEP